MPTREDYRLLLSPATRRRFGLALVGAVLTALADVVGVVAILPLMELLTGAPRDSGILGWVTERLGPMDDQTLAIVLAAFAFGAFTIKGVLAVAFKWWLLGFVSQQEAETSENLLAYYLEAPYGLHLQRNSADLLRTLNDAVRNVYTQQIVVNVVNVASELFTIVAVAVTLLVLAPMPALALLLYFAVAGALLYGFVRPMTQRAGERMVASYAGIYQNALQALGAIKEIKVRHKQGFFLSAFGEARRAYAESQRVASFFGELPRYVLEILFIFGIGLLTVFIFVTSPTAQSVGVLAILAAAGFRLLPSAVRLLSALNIIRFGRPSLDLVVGELREAQQNRAAEEPYEQPTAPMRVRREVCFESVTFRHAEQSTPAVSSVSFCFPAGSAVALVGPSGAGKSTLVDLLLGLQKPEEGRVTVDGTDIRSILPQWQSSLGLVPQEVYLLDTSLRENIAFGERGEDIDDDRLEQAIRGAQLESFIDSLPGGVEAHVGERGVRLSGGQRQRIGIARALYTRPSLLVLDEATSALDNETERRISQTIATLQGKVSILIVAHRLSTVRDCDLIVFLREGRVEATGTFDELQERSRDFARLVHLGSLS